MKDTISKKRKSQRPRDWAPQEVRARRALKRFNKNDVNAQIARARRDMQHSRLAEVAEPVPQAELDAFAASRGITKLPAAAASGTRPRRRRKPT